MTIQTATAEMDWSLHGVADDDEHDAGKPSLNNSSIRRCRCTASATPCPG